MMNILDYIDAVEHYVPLLEELGFTVGVPMSYAFWIQGYGVNSYFRLDDEEGLDSLLDPDAHAELVRSFEEETPEEVG